jgi:uncharacterized membrane protein YphA (DoxX/SURF4 family)
MMAVVADTSPGRATGASPARWQIIAGHASAVLLALLFLASGLWKMLELESAAERMVQSLVPVPLSLPVAVMVSVAETFVAVLLLLPGLRRWGAWLAGLMLVVFMAYIGIFYHRLLGEDCNCFPWIRRMVGPGFFAGDAGMLALAVLAGWRARRPRGVRLAAGILAGMLALALASHAISAFQRARIAAPESILVDGSACRLREGRFLLYFFDPECSHCEKVAREMARQVWMGARVITVPTAQPQFAGDFLRDSGLRVAVSSDADLLRARFPFTDSPYAVALVNGRRAATFNSGQLEGARYYGTLRKLGFIR